MKNKTNGLVVDVKGVTPRDELENACVRMAFVNLIKDLLSFLSRCNDLFQLLEAESIEILREVVNLARKRCPRSVRILR